MKNIDKMVKIWKRAGIIFAITVIVFLGKSITSFAYDTTNGNPNDASAKTIMSGHIGDHAEYTFYSNGDLFITGYGDMFDFPLRYDREDMQYSKTPWNVYLHNLAFEDYDTLVKMPPINVYIGADITAIGDCEFYSVDKLKSVIFESGSKCKSIGQQAFEYSFSLKSIQFPTKLKSIGSYAFWGTSLKSITIPQNVTKIGSCAFGYSPLKTITINSKKITSIGKNAIRSDEKQLVVKVPSSKYSAYKKLFKSKLEFNTNIIFKKF